MKWLLGLVVVQGANAASTVLNVAGVFGGHGDRTLAWCALVFAWVIFVPLCALVAVEWRDGR